MDDSDIVEIYSAANAVEAYAVANALESAGIKAHVVGDYLATGAGGFPLGMPIGPRVWVFKKDEIRARVILKKIETEAKKPPEAEESWLETDKSSPEELAEADEESLPPSTSGRNVGFISPLLGIVGIACISVGVFFSIENHRLRNHYSKTVQADLIDSALYYRWLYGKIGTDYPWSSGGGYTSKEPIWKTCYVYKVNDVLHTVEVDKKSNPFPNITIRYNPEKPADNYAGAILHPGWCLAFGCIFGALALFLAYQFR